MSANNWMECPKCKEIARSKHQKAMESYGKVSAGEYAKMLDDAMNAKNDRSETLAECYEIGVHEGAFMMSYKCICHRCGMEASFLMEESLD